MFCSNCGKEIANSAYMCPACGAPTANYNVTVNVGGGGNRGEISEKDWLTTLLLCFFLGGLGIHSFYAGKTLIGVLQLLTLGGCGIWSLIDFIIIVCGNYRDGEGRLIVNQR